MFFKDPSGNNLEFKAMTNPSNLFAKYNVDEYADDAEAKKAERKENVPGVDTTIETDEM